MANISGNPDWSNGDTITDTALDNIEAALNYLDVNAGGKIFMLYMGPNDVASSVPTGWTVTRSGGTGRTVVTHNFGDTNYFVWAITTSLAGGSASEIGATHANIEGSLNTNSFNIKTYKADGTITHCGVYIYVWRL